MKKHIRLVIIIWFIFSWLSLIVLTLKPTGTLNVFKRWLVILSEKVSIPSVWVISDFESLEGLNGWSTSGLIVTISAEHTANGRYCARINFINSQVEMAKLVLEDDYLGPKGKKDWSRFKFLKFSIFNPQEAALPVHVKIKDRAGRISDIAEQIKPKDNAFVLNLEDIGQFIDSSNVIYFNLYFPNPKKGNFLFLDAIRLERDALKETRILSRPILKLVAITYPGEVKRGNALSICATLSLLKRINIDYAVFIHISHESELKKRTAEHRWYINADQDTLIPTSKWLINTPYGIGPLSIFIPKDFPSGEYVIQIGLFNAASHGSYYKGSSFSGMVDFRTGYPRLNYTNTQIKDCIVGRVRVLD